MALITDPAGNEVRALKQLAKWRGKQVLEIGCGEGRLTARLARLGAFVQAIDPDARRIGAARQSLPKRYAPQITYRVGNAEKLAYMANTFDLVVFSWVL